MTCKNCHCNKEEKPEITSLESEGILQVGENPYLDAINHTRRFYVHGEINYDTLATVGVPLQFVIDTTPAGHFLPAIVSIDSPGGSLAVTLNLTNIITHSRIPIITTCNSFIHSGGAFLFITGHARYMTSNAKLYFHNARTLIEGEFTSNGIRAKDEILTQANKTLFDLIRANSKMTDKQAWSLLRDDFTVFTAEEALEKGLVDFIDDNNIIKTKRKACLAKIKTYQSC